MASTLKKKTGMREAKKVLESKSPEKVVKHLQGKHKNKPKIVRVK